MAAQNIYSLEVVVRKVTLVGAMEATNTCPLCVCLRFPGLVDMTVCEGDHCGNRTVGGGTVWMSRGTSSLFAVGADDLCRTARDFRADVAVYRHVDGTPETHFVSQPRLVAQTCVEFNESFTSLLLDPDQPEKTSMLNRTLALYETGHSTPVGTVELMIRMTSHGDLVTTEFSRIADSKKYNYKGLNTYVPINMSCKKSSLVDKCQHVQKCCKAKKTCKTKKPKDGNDVCNKEMNQVKCVLTVMEMMKDLFTKAAASSPSELNEQQTTRNPCMFDLNCPVARCPFRMDEPITAFVDRMVDGGDGRPTKTKTPASKSLPSAQAGADGSSENVEIEDDADVFVVSSGRVDPCRVSLPVHRENTTQYLETDLQPEFRPQPPQPPSKPAKKGGKKGK
ncbi:Hypothetical protein CINCED_3A019592 [Cinara cedri]|uniref:Uncharacterized protein n=1 Tax=Cinara cedri TaxID=506608 RepID=A0A5E4M599_9HEMI|nr:Hypothetical protein CINCED_3A019592 [Cinara cedri]